MRRLRWRVAGPLVLITLLGLWLRLLWLGAVPLRGDEAFAIQYWAAPWPGGLALTSVEPHPYGTFALFALWRAVFGDGEWVMRLLSALLSVPGSAALYVIGRRLFRAERAGLLAALLYAVHPFLIWHAQDARNYAIWAMVSAVTLAVFLRALAANQRRGWLLYSASALVGAYIFFFEILFIATHFLYLLLFRRSAWRRWLPGGALIGLGLIPWALQILTIMRSGTYGGTAGAFNFRQMVTWFPPTLAIGSTLPASTENWLWPVLLLAAAASLMIIGRKWPASGWLLALLLIVPLILFRLAALRMDIFRPRYVLPLTVVFIALASGATSYLTTRNTLDRIAAAAGLFALILLNGIALQHHYHDPAFAKAPDWRALGAFLTAQAAPDDLVIQQALDPAFTYYFRGPADETGLPLRANPPAEETIAYLETAAEQYAAIWFLPQDVPWWDAEKVPLAWLTANLQRTADLTVSGFELLRFQPWQVAADEITRELNLRFGEDAILRDWRITRLTDDLLHITLYWEPLTEPDSPLHGFVHLTGPPRPEVGQPLWSQDDHRVSDTHWEPGILRRDVYHLRLPASPSGGPWTLNIGLYVPETAQRLPVAGSDHISIPLNTSFTPHQP